MKQLDLPTSKDYFKEFLQRAVLPAKKKQSNTLFFLPGTGRTSLMRCATRLKTRLEKELEVEFGNLVWLLVDINDEKLLKEIWKQMLKSQGIAEKDWFKEDISLTAILDNLTNKMKQRVLLCVLVTEDERLVPWLESLRQVNSLMIDFQFAFLQEVELGELKDYLGVLTQFALQNVWYLPFYKEEDVKVVIQNQVEPGFSKINQKQEEEMINLSGGYPRLVRYFLRNPDKTNVGSWQEPEVKHYFEDIWDGLKENSRDWLFKLVGSGKKGSPGQPSAYLEKTGLVENKGNKWQLFSPLFEKYVNFLSISSPPQVREKEGKIEISGKNIELILSNRESEMFKKIWSRRGQIISRDEIAEVLWGKDWEDKYSDWAIDQAVSRIRRKLDDRSWNGLIETVRGKGFIING